MVLFHEDMNDKPPLPSIQPIPQALIDEWIKIPPGEQLTMSISRSDVDNLFFSINNLISSQYNLQESITNYSNGDLVNANSHMDLSRRSSVEALNSLRAFLTSIMASTLRNKPGNRT